MNDIVYIADFFVDQILGGGELNDDELIKMLESKNYNVQKIQSHLVTSDDLLKNKDSFFIISNFCNLANKHVEWLQENAKYAIYEHDHKYLSSRNPAIYKNFHSPSRDIRSYFFYKNARAVLCQSSFHKSIIEKNLEIDNVTNLSGNLWSLEALEHLRKLSKNEKDSKCSVLNSTIQHKNTAGAIAYCLSNNLEYEKVSSANYLDFLEKLSKNQSFVFLPKTPETLSRVAVEARMMNMSVRTNALVGASYEPWFKLKGEDLISHMIEKRSEIFDTIVNLLEQKIDKQDKKISIVSTFYKGEKFLEGFLQNMVEQTIFDKCELILLDSASPGREKKIIEPYIEKYSNIRYYRIEDLLKPTPCFNMAIQKARGKYITFGFIDDRKSKTCLEDLYTELEKTNVDLVYGDVAQTEKENEVFDDNDLGTLFEHSRYTFSRENMVKCLPGPMPMWKKSIHNVCGFFDDKDCDFADDWDMWLRAVQAGHVFKKIDKVVGLYLVGGRSQQENNTDQLKEEAKIFFKYGHLFGQNFKRFEPYFGQFMR